jgi:hypothetical protein
MKKITVYIPEKNHTEIKQAAKGMGLSVESIVRGAALTDAKNWNCKRAMSKGLGEM